MKIKFYAQKLDGIWPNMWIKLFEMWTKASR